MMAEMLFSHANHPEELSHSLCCSQFPAINVEQDIFKNNKPCSMLILKGVSLSSAYLICMASRNRLSVL